MSNIEQVTQALRDEIAWLNEWIDRLWHGSTGHIRDAMIARLAALTAALPAPGVEAPGDWVMVPRVATDAIQDAIWLAQPVTTVGQAQAAWTAMLSAAPSAPAEISQAQAQAMREAVLKEAAALADKEVKELKAFNFTQHSHGALIVKKAILAALPPEPPR